MKKYINRKSIIIFSSLLLVIGILITIIFFNPFLTIKTNSENVITLKINESFKPPIVKASLFNKDLSENIKQTGKVNSKKIGTYTLKYTISFLYAKKTLVFKVKVIDEESPIITLKGQNNIVMCPNTEYIEEGYTALDNYDGDITNNVKVQKIEDGIKYSVLDSSNNLSEVKREIIYEDKENPSISLIGFNTLKITVNSNYNELGFIASDNCDGDITSNVEVIDGVDTSNVGSYIVTYKVKDKSGNEVSINRTVEVVYNSSHYTNIIMGPTYINGILIVNKKYSLPRDYGAGVDSAASSALTNLQNEASRDGYSIPLLSSYRSYDFQSILYNNYVKVDGAILADTYSARPGHSEHQTGLAFDVGALDDNYGNTPEGIWLKDNAHRFGFIIRYPKGKEHITGYQYEPWHIRYLGVDHATEIYNKNITLEEYLGVN